MLSKYGIKISHSNDSGFSLIEVAIAVVVISMVMVPVFSFYKAKEIQTQITDTNSKLANIENGINQFFFAGAAKYPCPASLIVGEGNALHGKEFVTCNDLSTIKLCSNPLWDDAGNEGLCKTSNNVWEAVLIGAVPFDRISLTPKDTLDVWGNKIIYAVTYEQTQSTSFNTNTGQLNIWSYNDHDNDPDTPSIRQDVTDAGNVPDFILFSSGSGSISAYTEAGVLTSACPTATNLTESENCDLDDTFFVDVNPNDPDEGSRAFANNNVYYDDITRIQYSLPQAIWFPHPDDVTHVMTLSTRVGIGTDTPVESLDVNGNIRADNAVKSDSICLNSDKSNCFNPRFVTEVTTCIGDTNAGVIEMGSNVLRCATGVNNSGTPISGSAFAFGTGYQATTCPSNRIQQGFDASGAPICVTN